MQLVSCEMLRALPLRAPARVAVQHAVRAYATAPVDKQKDLQAKQLRLAEKAGRMKQNIGVVRPSARAGPRAHALFSSSRRFPSLVSSAAPVLPRADRSSQLRAPTFDAHRPRWNRTTCTIRLLQSRLGERRLHAVSVRWSLYAARTGLTRVQALPGFQGAGEGMAQALYREIERGLRCRQPRLCLVSSSQCCA